MQMDLLLDCASSITEVKRGKGGVGGGDLEDVGVGKVQVTGGGVRWGGVQNKR